MNSALTVSLLSALAVTPMALAVRTEAAANTALVAKAANAFLDGLSAAQRKKAQFGFADAERTNWQFVPGIYPGVTLGELGLSQKRAVHRLLNVLLSGSGYGKVTAIMKLEDTLRQMAEANGQKAPFRDPKRYSIAVFGKPGGTKPWSVRLQGHHVSLNFTAADGKLVALTPMFLGANPAEVRKGAHAGSRALPEEEDLARQLLGSLTDEQRKAAMLADQAPADVLWGPGKRREVLQAPHGVMLSQLDTKQRVALWRLINTYVGNLRPADAMAQRARIQKGAKTIRFGWMGSAQSGKGHYYRIVGETFAIEYDNTQNGANHVHVVWHDLTDDFGVDWLKQHYQREHGK